MFAPILSVPLGRHVAHGDLYAVTFHTVPNTRCVVVPEQVEIDEVADDSLYVHSVGALYVTGLTLEQRGA